MRNGELELLLRPLLELLKLGELELDEIRLVPELELLDTPLEPELAGLLLELPELPPPELLEHEDPPPLPQGILEHPQPQPQPQPEIAGG